MLFFKLFILLFLNTLIEFLPISSTAHSILINKILTIDFNLNLILSFAQIAISLSVCFYFKNEIINLIKSLFMDTKNTFIFLLKILITMLPTMLFGLCCYETIKEYLYLDKIIAINLIFGAILMLVIERLYKKNVTNNNINYIEKFEEIDFMVAFKIGIFQCFSLIPGISRSASTIVSGLFCNLPRNIAVKFSFFISIPISILAALFDIYKNVQYINNNNISVLIFCFLVSLLFSMIFIKKILLFLQKNTLNIFVYYRIFVGIIILLSLMF